jgi:hypothetical protein
MRSVPHPLALPHCGEEVPEMDFDLILTGLESAWADTAAATPRIVGALAIFLIGWLAAGLLRMAAHRVLDLVRFDEIVQRAGVPAAAERTGYDPKGLVGGIVYWTVLLLTVQLAAETLRLDALSTAMAGMVAYLPQVLVAVGVVVVAMAFGNFVASAVHENTRSALATAVARYAIYGFGAFAALSQLGIAADIVNALFYATVATIGATFVVAFGIGGIPAARKLVGRWTGEAEDRHVKAA